ncbi:MAG: MarR family winged helix-turn-helix transcriptional regulator [Acidimicrobiia bacterium]
MSAEGQSIADQLHSAAVHLVRTVASVDTQMGVSPARASVLSILVFGGPRTIGQLAAAERVRSPSMTALVNGLVTDGLARKRPSPHDARSVVVEPTARGRRVLDQGRARRVARLEQLMTGLDADELACLQRAAAIMQRATTATADQPCTPAGT